MANVIKHKRGSGSDPSASDLVVGEVAIRTDVGKLFTKMDNGSVSEIAGGGSDIIINTLSSSSGTGGGSATFNGSAYRFTLSQPPSVSAQQLLVSINGVIQKPVAGTGQPSEGFSVDGNDIILGDAPATGSDFFILTFKSLGVSEPADNSVTSAKIVDGAIVNADINASAAIAGSKISPDFGSQGIATTANIASNADNSEFRCGTNADFKISHTGSENILRGDSPTVLRNAANNETLAKFTPNGAVELYHDNTKRFETGSLGVRFFGNLYADDNEKLLLGNSQDLQIYHDGSHSRIVDSGTGNLILQTSKLNINNADGSEALIHATENGKIELYHDNSVRFETTSSGVEITSVLGIANVGGTLAGSGGTENWLGIKDSAGNFQFAVKTHGTNNGSVGIGTTSPTRPLHITSDEDLSSFTGTTKGAFCISNNDYANGEYSAIDFTYTGSDNPIARIATKITSGGSYLSFGTSNNYSSGVTNEALTLDTSGNVGIGTASPGALLTLNSTTPDLRLNSSNNNFGMGDELGRISLYTSDGSTPGTGEVFRIKTESASSIGADYTTRLTNRTGAGGGQTEVSLGNGEGSIYFATNTTGNNAAVRMKVGSDGKVGIGTTSPVDHLQTHDGSATTVYHGFTNSTTGATGNDGFRVGIDSNANVNIWDHENTYMNFGTNNTERMRITSSGKVGIGTSSPERQLHIVGNDGATGATLGNSDTCLVLDNQQGNGTIMEFLSDNDGAGRIMFTDTDASNRGKIQYFHNNDFFQIEVATSSQSTMALHLTKQNAANNVQSDMIAFDVGGSGRGKIVSAHSGSSSPQFSSYSDRRLKTNIKDYTGGYEKIKSLKIRIYDEISNDDTKSIIGDIPAKNVIGYIADEFQEVFPQEVRGTKDEIDSDGKPVYQSISDTFLTPYLVQALQEAVGKIETLETKVAALEAK